VKNAISCVFIPRILRRSIEIKGLFGFVLQNLRVSLGSARSPFSSGLQSFQLGGRMIQLAADHGFVAQEFVEVPLTMGRGNVGILFHPIGAFLK